MEGFPDERLNIWKNSPDEQWSLQKKSRQYRKKQRLSTPQVFICTSLLLTPAAQVKKKAELEQPINRWHRDSRKPPPSPGGSTNKIARIRALACISVFRAHIDVETLFPAHAHFPSAILLHSTVALIVMILLQRGCRSVSSGEGGRASRDEVESRW